MSLNKIERRERIKMRIRKIVSGTQAQPRMTVYRSNKQIYVQFIDDLAGVTLATASSLDKEVAEALKVSRRTLQNLRNNRVLPFILFGGKALYREYDIQRLLEANYRKADV